VPAARRLAAGLPRLVAAHALESWVDDVRLLEVILSRPARVFLGDGGSMPVGFIVAAV
jgi:hypothetical protein